MDECFAKIVEVAVSTSLYENYFPVTVHRCLQMMQLVMSMSRPWQRSRCGFEVSLAHRQNFKLAGKMPGTVEE